MPQCQEPNREVVEVAFELIDPVVTFDHLTGEVAVPRDDRLYRRGKLAFGKAAHLADHFAEALQFLVVALDDVLGNHVCLALTRSGR